VSAERSLAQTLSLLKAVDRKMTELASRDVILRANEQAEEALQEPGVLETPSEPPLSTASSTVDLPSLPEGLNPVSVVRHMDYGRILADPRFNPSGRKLSRLESVKVRAELTRAKAMTDVLESEAKVEIVGGMDKLRESGNFIEYQKGESYQLLKDAITSAEEVEPGRIRMFYFLPEDFPELHAKKQEKRQVADVALRKVAAIIRGVP
jgi:hypothetical protein